MSQATVDDSSLIRSSAKWIGEALSGVLEDDPEKIVLMAPVGVELLGKAVLWRANPMLLLRDNVKIEVKIALARDNDLASPKVRTLSLEDVLSRTAALLGAFPLNDKQQALLCEVRNGVVHVGVAAPSGDIIVYALQAADVMLAHLSIERGEFYGNRVDVADTLLDKKHSEVSRSVELKVQAARRRLAELEESLGEEAFREAFKKSADQTLDVINPKNFGSDHYGIWQECPGCLDEGLLMGRIDVDFGIEHEYGPEGPEDFYVHTIQCWTPWLYPGAFACNVCRLTLEFEDELEAAGLPTEKIKVSDDDLYPAFDSESFASDLYDSWD